MEKTLEIHLKETLQELSTQIRDTPVPEEMTWEERVGYMVAKNYFANLLVAKYANL